MLTLLKELFTKDNYYNCTCRSVTKEGKKRLLKKLEENGGCPICAKFQEIDQNPDFQ